jgi:rRNA-processing protein FCF1
MPDRRNPMDDTERMVVDGSNLLHAIGRTEAAPPAAVIGRLRAAVPSTITIDLVFDGRGSGPKGRVATGMQVRFAGGRPGDDVVLELAEQATRDLGGGPGASARVLVVTDDRELRGALGLRGIRTAGTRWLMGRIDRYPLASPAAGNRRPALGQGRPPASGEGGRLAGPVGTVGGPGGPADPRVPGSKAEDAETPRRSWQPGRRATAKAGPAHKKPRHKRHPQR